METIHIGQVLVCHETGETFIAKAQGHTFNYARDDAGNVYSDEGVRVREERALLDRSRPFVAYVASDGLSVTGWKGNRLGAIVWRNPIRLARWSHWHGSYINAYRIKDIHGGYWHGRGSKDIAITLRPMKPPS